MSEGGKPESAVQARILAAAKTEFARRGLKGASVRAIAGRARVTAAMINYYFRGKQALYDAVVSEAMERLYARLGGALTAKARAHATALAEAYFDFLVCERELQMILLREMLDHGEGASRFARRHMPILGAMIGAGIKHKDRERLLHTAVSLFGAVAGYFIYEPVLKGLLEGPLLSGRNLDERRRHVLELASRLEPAAKY